MFINEKAVYFIHLAYIRQQVFRTYVYLAKISQMRKLNFSTENISAVKAYEQLLMFFIQLPSLF